MAYDLTTELRRTVIRELETNAAMLTLVPAGSYYPQQAPANAPKPFVKSGTTIGSPGPTLGGERIRMPLHIATGSREVDGAEVETAEDYLGRIVAMVKHLLHRRVLIVPGARAKLRFVNDIRRRSDGSTDIFEANIEFIARILA